MKKRYTVHEVISMLEEDDDFMQANIYIAPPGDPACSDEDSADEEHVTIDNLPRRQLQAEAEATVVRASTARERICEFDDISDQECEVTDETSTSLTRTSSPVLQACLIIIDSYLVYDQISKIVSLLRHISMNNNFFSLCLFVI